MASDPPSPASTAPGASAAPSAPTHPCVRCGRPTAIERGLCEECNPLGLRDSSSSQVHGTAVVGVLVAIVVLAVVGRLAVSGVGPFDAAIGDVKAADNGLTVTLEVTNRGSSTGGTLCRVTDASVAGTTVAALIQSPRIEPGQTRSFSQEVTQFGSEPLELAVECHDP